MNKAEHYNRLYIKYACFMEDTEHNFMKSLEYRKKYGKLTNNQQILNEVKLAKSNYFKYKNLKIVS